MHHDIAKANQLFPRELRMTIRNFGKLLSKRSSRLADRDKPVRERVN